MPIPYPYDAGTSDPLSLEGEGWGEGVCPLNSGESGVRGTAWQTGWAVEI